MSDSRLNGLALLYVHRIPLNYDSVIDDFAKGNRRLEFWMTITIVLHSFQILMTLGLIAVLAECFA